ncbi:MAG: hypothetical protein KF891_24355 [Rhizobacter sp.]|nr:hypothetical protein [Rhizobacter sp.]
MALTLNNRVIADTRLQSIHGQHIAGGHRLQLSIEFTVHHWTRSGPPPQALFGPARVAVSGQPGLILGIAHPQTSKPFRVDQYGGKFGCIFELDLDPHAMEAVERYRNGLGVALDIRLHAQVFGESEIEPCFCDIHGRLNLSEWIDALNQAGFGHTALFEIPLPMALSADGSATELLSAAQRLLTQGHYAEVVAKCRMVLERLTQERQEDGALQGAKDAQKQKRTLLQRELLMRQAAIDFANLAHHPTDSSLTELFDRNAALMMLGTTAALVSSGLARDRNPDPQV